MTTFSSSTLVTERLWLRAFRAGDLDADAAMQDHRPRRRRPGRA
jgi:hypothetical protein